MNLKTSLHSVRTVLASLAFAAVVLTVGSGLDAHPSGHHDSDVSQATKEWRPRASTTTDVVLATKEWKRPR